MKHIRTLAVGAAVFLACCLPLAPGARGGTPQEDAAQYQADLNAGIDLLKSGSRDEISRSIAKFKSALKLRPESAEAYYWIALAYSDLNNYLRAADNAKDATIYDERLVDAWLLWGQVLLYQKEWDEALKKLETAARLAPEDPQVLYNLGRVYYHGFRDPDAALPKFRAVWQRSQALRRDRPDFLPMLVLSRLYMGYCEFDRGRWDNAINAFLDVLADQPGNVDAAFRLAICYRQTNRPGECERMLLDLLKAVPQNGTANRQFLAEVNLQLADLYLKDPVRKNSMLAEVHLREFVNLVNDVNHPAFEPAREYLAALDKPAN